MAERFDVRITVKQVPGKCNQGHFVGEEWVMGKKTPEGICLSAFNAIFPPARVLSAGGGFSYQTDPDVMQVICPDPKCPVLFELRRIKAS